MNDLADETMNPSNSTAQPACRRTAKIDKPPEPNQQPLPKPKPPGVGVRIRALRRAKGLTLAVAAKNAAMS